MTQGYEHLIVLAIAIAVCLMGQNFAGGMLLIGYEVGFAVGKVRQRIRRKRVLAKAL